MLRIINYMGGKSSVTFAKQRASSVPQEVLTRTIVRPSNVALNPHVVNNSVVPGTPDQTFCTVQLKKSGKRDDVSGRDLGSHLINESTIATQG